MPQERELQAQTQSAREMPSANAFEWLESIAFSLCITLTILVFCFSVSRISGVSMMPTLQDGDQVLLRAIGYTPQHGDVITTDANIAYGKPLAKRVIGLPGDVVNIDTATGAVLVNDTVLDEPYISAPTVQSSDVIFPYTVPQGCVFVMGDNRPHSLDSRWVQVGSIDIRDILGKVIVRLSPNMGKIE